MFLVYVLYVYCLVVYLIGEERQAQNWQRKMLVVGKISHLVDFYSQI